MTLEIEFEEQDCTFEVEFEQLQTADSGGYEEGYEKGHADGVSEGHAGGRAEGYTEGFTAGEKSEYDRFWDEYQRNGTLVDYTDMFSGTGWRSSTFIPKYDMQPSRAQTMFRYTLNLKIDLVEHLKSLGRVLDFSKSTMLNSAFSYSNIIRLGVIDTSNASALAQMFHGCNIETIDKLVLKNDGSQTFSGSFSLCDALKSITIEGVIGKDISFSDSILLNKPSITSIMTAVSLTATLTVTFSKVAVDNAFETTEGAADGSTSAEWLDLVSSRPNATIALA